MKKLLNLFLIFVIPVFWVLIIISVHSNELIKVWMQWLILLLLILDLGYLIYLSIKNKKDNNKFRVNYVLLSFWGLFVLGCNIFLFVLYGANHNFRDWLVTTAMGTMNHQYICKWFYNQDEINEVFANNYIIENNDPTDPDLVDFNPEDKTDYNEYEKLLFENRKDEEIYRIIRFEVNDCKAYLAAVYDPARIKVVVSNNFPEIGQYVTKMAEIEKAPLAINGGGFVDPGHVSLGGMPAGITISKGKIFTGLNENNNVIGMSTDNKLVLLKNKNAQEVLDMGIRDAITHYPYLIVNGKSSFIKGTGGYGYAARSAIGQRADGTILLLVVDSNAFRTKGASMHDLANIMQNYGAINAANLDGGTSSVMVENYQIINQPIDSALQKKTRPIATAIVVTGND